MYNSRELFILACSLYIFVFLSLVIMVWKFDHNFRNFFLLPIHLFPYVSCFVLLSVFPTSFHLRTKFPVNWDRMLCICKSQCCGVLYVGQTRRHIYTRVSLNTWVFHLWLERKFCFNHVRHTRSSLVPVVLKQAREKRGCSARLGPRCDVTAKGASERLADFNIFNMAENLYIEITF
jgi:hypothetical protein